MHRIRLKAPEGPAAWGHLSEPREGLWVSLTVSRLVAGVSVAGLEGELPPEFRALAGRGLCAARLVPADDAEKSEMYHGETLLADGVLHLRFGRVLPAGLYDVHTGALSLSSRWAQPTPK